MKGSAYMNDIAAELQEQLEIRTVFTVPVGKWEIPISESTVVTWIIIGVVLLICLILGTNLKVKNISKRQALSEFIVTKLEGLVAGMIGEEGKGYVPYLLAVFIFLMFPPTSVLR